MGAAEDGRAPTEEGVCVWLRWFCWTGAAEDGRALAEELACLRLRDFCSTEPRDGCAPTEGTKQNHTEPAKRRLAFRHPFRFSGDRLDYRWVVAC